LSAAANFAVSAEDDRATFKLALLDERRMAVVDTAAVLADGTAIPFTLEPAYEPGLIAECCDATSDSASIHQQIETATS